MKKKISMILCMILVLQALIVPAYAVDDMPGLNYQIVLNIFDESGKAAVKFDQGDTVLVEVVLKSIGTNVAPIYAVQGKLNFDSYSMSYSSSTLASDFQVSTQTDKVTFAFLDRTGAGKNVENSYVIGNFKFVAKAEGTSNLTIDDFQLTNSDATTRNVDSSAIQTVIIGSGVRPTSKSALLSDINSAEADLASAVVSDENLSLVYPAFRVTLAVAATFRSNIDSARLVYNNLSASNENIDDAIGALSQAHEQFKTQKIYGTKKSNNSTTTNVVKVTVTASSGEHGSINPSSISQTVNSGTSVTIISIPDDGYMVEYVYVNGEKFDGSEIFSIPSVTHNTVVKVTFCWKNPFTDVEKGAWYHDAVEYALKAGLFKGTSTTTFEPNSTMTRAMIVKVLYSLAGEPAVTGENSFSDVSSSDWYADAVYWANSNDIVGGYGNGLFGTNDSITRQDMVVIMYRYAKNNGYDVSIGDDTNISKYNDTSEISEYAIPAMQWAIGTGLIKGTSENILSPVGTTTRAQVAAILMRFVEKAVIE